ncbi:tRNA guanosine(34) transglycosylase Tgt [bacterium]|nr:tRNA guanosine(34) transglycosylase Tgt [bacterium]
MNFTLISSSDRARRGAIDVGRGIIKTPAFSPVATQATVKGISPDELYNLGAEIILVNAYHLYLRPGEDIIAKLGGVHRFMNWKLPILSDSGGYQIFSLAGLRKVTEEGVRFQSHIDGSYHLVTPESSIRFQEALGTDIMMVLDECPPYPCNDDYTRQAKDRTTRWARRAKEAASGKGVIFGIVQGGVIRDLRRQSAEELTEIGFDGYAVGGLSVGEPKELTYEVISYVADFLPKDKPRYLMGFGRPEDILFAVEQGFDLFDCVMPTRHGRTGQAFTSCGLLNIRNAAYASNQEAIDSECKCPVCREYSLGYIRHLIHQSEILGARLLTLHNLYFYLHLMRAIQEAISEGRFSQFKKKFLTRYNEANTNCKSLV